MATTPGAPFWNAATVDAVDRLDPLPPAVTGGITVLVDRTRPVAAVHAADGSVRVITWSDAPLPASSATARLCPAPGCVLVVDAEDTMDGPGTSASTAVRLDADGQVAACELGILEAIGADSDGVWLSPHRAGHRAPGAPTRAGAGSG